MPTARASKKQSGALICRTSLPLLDISFFAVALIASYFDSRQLGIGLALLNYLMLLLILQIDNACLVSGEWKVVSA